MTSHGAGARGRRPPAVLGVATDLDGTLLRSDGTLSPLATWLLRALRGLGTPLVVATGRTPRAVRKIVGHEDLGRVVCANGAIVWDSPTDEVVRECCFEPGPLAAALTRLREALPEAGLALLTAQTMFLDGAYAALRTKGADGAELLTDLGGALASHRIAMVAVRHPRMTAEELVGPAAEAFTGIGMASFAGLGTVDIAPRATTKAEAVAHELAGAGCPPGSAVVFGDMPNDLPLFAWAGWACAVANGHRSVLQAADEIVPSNDDDGVARTVQRLLGL